MKSFYVVDTATRRILRHGYCVDSDVALQARPSQEVYEDAITNENYHIDGAPVYIAPPPPPSPTLEEIAEQDEKAFSSEVLRLIAKAFFLHENRLRVLEGKAPVTWEQFKAAIRGMA